MLTVLINDTLCLEENRENQTAGEKRKSEKRKLTEEIKKSKAAKELLNKDMQKKSAEIESRIFTLEEELGKKY